MRTYFETQTDGPRYATILYAQSMRVARLCPGWNRSNTDSTYPISNGPVRTRLFHGSYPSTDPMHTQIKCRSLYYQVDLKNQVTSPSISDC